MPEEGLGILANVGAVIGGGIGIIGYVPLLICVGVELFAGVCIISGAMLSGSSYFAFYIDDSLDETVLCDEKTESVVRDIGSDYVVLVRTSNSEEFGMKIPDFRIYVGQTVDVYKDCEYEPCFGESVTYDSCGSRWRCTEADLDHYWEPPESDTKCIGAIFFCIFMFIFSIFVTVIAFVIALIIFIVIVVVGVVVSFSVGAIPTSACGIIGDMLWNKYKQIRKDDDDKEEEDDDEISTKTSDTESS